MTYYNEIFFVLFGFIFLILAISSAPYYRKDAIERQSLLLAGIPLAGAVSYFLFLIAPVTSLGWLTIANMCLIASTLGGALLVRKWRDVESQKLWVVLAVLWVITGIVFEYLRVSGTFEQRVVLVVSWIVVSGAWTCVEAYRLYKSKKSFFILGLMGFTAAWVVVNFLRLLSVVFSDWEISHLYQEPLSLVLFRFISAALHLFCPIFMLAYSSERLNAQSLAFQKESQNTQLVNAELSQLVRERDHMLMINSRFSTVSSLAMFNSAIVHELSQPLTALTLTLHDMQYLAKDVEPSFQGALDESVNLVQKIGQMTHSLRRLMLDQKPELQTFDMCACIQEILPILNNESRSRTIEFTGPETDQAFHVLAHKVLLERILFNLVANAIDALGTQSNRPHAPRIELLLQPLMRDNRPHVRVCVNDNGPGFADHLLTEAWMHFQSTKATGMGVGLILGRHILNTWQGEFLLENLPTGGASVQLWLPLAEAP
ncbi:BaeS Signal transduction histidine kinase [Burkholderiaceae bacterium]